ncbi:MAG: PilZ domain-containing protein [Bradymonadia bacterium]
MLTEAEAVGHEARLYFMDGRQLKTLVGYVTHGGAKTLTLRTSGDRPPEEGLMGVIAVQTDDAVYRARVELVEVGDFVACLKLLAELKPCDRRLYGRAEVTVRLLARRVGQRLPRANHLSVVPQDGAWSVEEVVLSPSGMRATLPGNWTPGEFAELRLHVPGHKGGDHVVVQGEVVQHYEDGNVAFRFVELDADVQYRLAEIVDRVRLAQIIEGGD